jgi:hypothetical protein
VRGEKCSLYIYGCQVDVFQYNKFLFETNLGQCVYMHSHNQVCSNGWLLVLKLPGLLNDQVVCLCRQQSLVDLAVSSC